MCIVCANVRETGRVRKEVLGTGMKGLSDFTCSGQGDGDSGGRLMQQKAACRRQNLQQVARRRTATSLRYTGPLTSCHYIWDAVLVYLSDEGVVYIGR